MSMTWGLSGPEQLGGERRTRTLDIGAAVREYNERAVPGMGGVWYAKQLFFAMLGIALAQRLRERKATVSNIEVANAIEALGCYFALKQNKGQGDARVRGSEKLRGKADFDFQTLCKPGFYVSQPMRMGTGQALLGLGLVRAQGERFNAFTCTDFGHEFVNACCGDDGALLEELVQWAQKGSSVDKLKSPIPELLSPLQVLPAQARALLSRRIDRAIRLWLKSSAYTRQLLQGTADADVWTGAASVLAWFTLAHGLLKPEVAVLEVGELFDAWIARNGGLESRPGKRRRPTMALRALLAEDEPKALLAEVIDAVDSHLRGRLPLVKASSGAGSAKRSRQPGWWSSRATAR